MFMPLDKKSSQNRSVDSFNQEETLLLKNANYSLLEKKIRYGFYVGMSKIVASFVISFMAILAICWIVKYSPAVALFIPVINTFFKKFLK